MEPILLQPTPDTPKIVLDPQNNIYQISGRSIPVDAVSFYTPVLNWLDNLSPSEIIPKLSLEIKMDYFNTASSKMILNILIKLKEMKESNKCYANVKWHFEKGDIDMQETGEEFAELVDLNFEFVSN